MKRYITLLLSAGILFSGCAVKEPKPIEKPKAPSVPLITQATTSMVCKNLQRPEYLSFKQVAFAVAKKEHLDIGEIADLYFFDKKFKASSYSSIPSLKIDLEKKHNVYIDTFNYAMNNRQVDIIAHERNVSDWLKTADKRQIIVTKGVYRVDEVLKYLSKVIKVEVAPEFLPMSIIIDEERTRISALDLLNKITKSIAAIANYDYKIENNVLHIINSTPILTIKDTFVDPFIEMMDRRKIYYQKTDNTFVVKDSIYNLWFSKLFLKSLNMSEDRFNFCVHMDGEDVYGSFTGNERIVLKDLGKIQLVDYGMVYEGKLKYKLKIESLKDKGVQEYTVYGDQDTFSTQINDSSVIKIKLF